MQKKAKSVIMTGLGVCKLKFTLERDGFNQVQGGIGIQLEIDNRQCEVDVKNVKLLLNKVVELRDKPSRKITHQIEDHPLYREVECILKAKSGIVKQGSLETMTISQ
jgi:hypothetical protein